MSSEAEAYQVDVQSSLQPDCFHNLGDALAYEPDVVHGSGVAGAWAQSRPVNSDDIVLPLVQVS